MDNSSGTGALEKYVDFLGALLACRLHSSGEKAAASQTQLTGPTAAVLACFCFFIAAHYKITQAHAVQAGQIFARSFVNSDSPAPE